MLSMLRSRPMELPQIGPLHQAREGGEGEGRREGKGRSRRGTSSKCKYSALDDLSSTPSISSKKHTTAAAMKDVTDGMAIISDSISDLTAECKHYWEHQEFQESLANARDIQASQQASASSPMCRQAALKHLQKLNSDLDPLRMVNLTNHIAKSTVVADTYMS